MRTGDQVITSYPTYSQAEAITGGARGSAGYGSTGRL